MKATTPKFKQIMASGNAREYVVKIDLTLADSDTNPTVLHLTEADIWNDTFSIETASSGTSSFDIGTAVIGQCKFSLNNFDERFNQYDFFNASAVVWIGLVGDIDNNEHQVYYRVGFFTVDEPTFAGALIQLILLDNMWRFDVPMITLNYPISCLNAILAICSHCDVQLDQTVQFHGASFTISEAPEGIDNMNCREFIQYVAMIGCNFCIITPEGKLKLRWYEGSPGTIEDELDGGTFDTSTTPYSDGDNADGGNLTDYTSGDSYDGGSFVDDNVYFTRNFNLSVGTDEITITGVKFTLGDTAHTIGTTGYVLELENPLVNESNVNSVLNLIWDVLENFKLRTFNLTTTSNYPAEVGDCCVIKDYKGNYIVSWITINSFKFASHQLQCNAIAPTRTLTKRYSKIVQAAVEEARQAAGQVISNYDLAVQMMNSLAVNAMGGYEEYEDLPTGGRVWYLSNMPITKDATTGVCTFESGSTVYKKSGSGFFVSRDGGTTWVNGYDMSTGELVVNVLDAIGINFDWARGGTLTLGGLLNGNGVLSILDSLNVEKVHGDNEGLKIGATTGSKIFINTNGEMRYLYDNAYAGKIHMDAVNYGTEEEPKLRDTFLIENFNDMGFRTDEEMAEIYMSTEQDSESSYDTGYIKLFAHKQTGEQTYQYSELRLDGNGFHIDSAIFTGGGQGYSGAQGHPDVIGTDFKRHTLTFANGICIGYESDPQQTELPHVEWHRWASPDPSTYYVAITLGEGVTQAVFPECESSDDEVAYEPFIKSASGTSAPKITDMSQSGSTITVTFTAVTAAQAAGNACAIRLLKIRG